MGARVVSKAIALVALFERLLDRLDVNAGLKVVFLAVEVAQSVLDVVMSGSLGTDDGGLVVSTGSEDVASLGAGRDATTSIIADRAFHGVLLSYRADGDAGVEGGEQRIDIELGERQVEYEVERGCGSDEEDEIDNSEEGGERTSLERESDQPGDDVVSGSETCARLVKREDQRACDEHVGQRRKGKPQNDDDLEFVELLEEQHDLDTNRGTDGAEERDKCTDANEGGHDLGVHQLVHTPSEEELGGKGNDTGHDRVGGEGAVAYDGVLEVAKVGDKVLVHEDLIEDGVDGVGDDKEEDKVPHERLVSFEVDVVDISLDDGETMEPDVEHAANVHASQPEIAVKIK